jgi:AcrR family transcriptional regulator
MSTPPPTRNWLGEAPDQRVSARRQRLVEAATDLLGAPQRGQYTMRAVCRRAGLTQRYFYESFTDSAALITAVYADIVNGLPQSGSQLSAHRAVAQVVLNDRRIGRILFREPLADAALLDLATQSFPAYLARTTATPLTPWGAQAVTGAMFTLYAMWTENGTLEGVDEFATYCARLTEAILGAK